MFRFGGSKEKVYQYDFTPTAEVNDEVDYTKQSKQFSLYSISDKSEANGYSLGYDKTVPAVSFSPSTSNNNSRISPNLTDWNTNFQSLIEEVNFSEKFATDDIQSQRVLAQNQVNASSKLRELCSKFGEEATVAAQIIVNEKYLPVEEKTIKPCDIGGLAGGAKFIFGNIILKFAVDNHGIYGGNDELIMKVANQELLSLVSLIECNVAGLFFPLMAIVDYHGYRMIASSLLPIGKDTLVYGSADAGLNVFDNHPEAKEKMKQACTRLNLKLHKFETVDFWGPVDMEVHVGTDKRLYVIDTSRLFPPTLPVAKNSLKRSGQLLAYHFRPQVLKKIPFPISSDALSGFGVVNKETHNKDILAATRILIEEMIPAFLAELTKKEYEYRKLSIGAICKKIHIAGINLRYLGVMRRMTDSPLWKNILLLAMIARAAKSELRKEWRSIKPKKQPPQQMHVPLFYSESFDDMFEMKSPVTKSKPKFVDKKEAKPTSLPKKSSIDESVSEIVDQDQPYKATVAKYITTFIYQNEAPPFQIQKVAKQSTTREIGWSKITEAIQWKFVDGLTDAEIKKDYDLRNSLPKNREWVVPLISYFLKLVGAKLINLYHEDPMLLLKEQFITQTHIAKLEARTKHMSFVLRDEGIAKVDLAKFSFGDGTSLNYLTEVSSILKDASSLKSDDLEVTKYRGINVALLAEYSLDPILKMKYLNEAMRHLDKCISANEKDIQAKLYKAHTLYQLGIVTPKLKDASVIFPRDIQEVVTKNLQKKMEHVNPGSTGKAISQSREKLTLVENALQELVELQKQYNDNSQQTAFNETQLLQGELLLQLAQLEQSPEAAANKAKEALVHLESVDPSSLVNYLRTRLAIAHSSALVLHAQGRYTGQYAEDELINQVRKAIVVLRNAFEFTSTSYDKIDFNLMDKWGETLKHVSGLFSGHQGISEMIQKQQAIYDSRVRDLHNFQLSVSAASIQMEDEDSQQVEIRIQTSDSKYIPFLKYMDFDFHPSIPMPTQQILYAPFVLIKKCEGSSTVTITLHFLSSVCPKGIKFNFLLSSEQTLRRTVYDIDLKQGTVSEYKETPHLETDFKFAQKRK